MKKTIFAVGIMICALATLLLWLWRSLFHYPVAQTQESSTSPMPAQTPAVTAPPNAAPTIPVPDLRSKEERISEILAMTSLQPITFYGKVIDQSGNPVVGAQVRGSVEISRLWLDQKWDEYFTTTDNAGNFQFTGLHGQNFVVFPKKEGYEYKAKNEKFAYSSLTPDRERHRPDQFSPVVFNMWKLKGAEHLTHTMLNRIGIPVDGTSVTFDLVTGKKVADDGDLTIKLQRNPIHLQAGERFDWTVTLEAVDGGLIETRDEYANEAPADGYDPAIVIDMPASRPDWQRSVTRSFYFSSQSGKHYGRVTMRISAFAEPPPTGLTIEAFVNTSGSRNLEFDPAKQAAR